MVLTLMKRRLPSLATVLLVGLYLITHGSLAIAQITTNNLSSPELELGQKLYRERKFVEAEKSFKKAVKQNKRNGDGWYYLGMSLLQQKKFKDATKAFETSVKLQSTSARARSGLAYSLLLRNKLREALNEAEQALALDANHADAHFIIGVANLRRGDREKALRSAERAIQLNNSFADAYLLKSQTLVQFTGDVMIEKPEAAEDRTRRYQEAVTALESFLRLANVVTDRQLWTGQLEALKFHLAMQSPEKRLENDVYKGRDVSTKARLISKPEPEYTESAKRNQVTGTVVLKSLFAADGTVKHIVVVYGLPDGLTWRAVEAARKIRFTPATLNGRPVSLLMQLEYNFNLY